MPRRQKHTRDLSKGRRSKPEEAALSRIWLQHRGKERGDGGENKGPMKPVYHEKPGNSSFGVTEENRTTNRPKPSHKPLKGTQEHSKASLSQKRWAG